MTAWLWAIAGVWLAVALWHLWAVLAVPDLPDLPPMAAAPPRVTALLAARDEAARVEPTVRRLLAQRGVLLDLVAVDDRSRDSTGAILERMARDEARVRVHRVAALPPGWLGKCHALDLASRDARGDWLLFTDADVWLGDDVVARAVAAAVAAGADHVCLLPRQHRASLAGQAVMLLFTLSLLERFARTRWRLLGAHAGIGAFNLVRADRYRALGGHQALRLEVVDDIRLGLLVQRSGGRTLALLAAGDAEMEYAADVRGFLRVTEKNLFAYLRLRTVPVALAAVGYAAAWVGALTGPVTGTLAGAAALAALLLGILPAALAARRLRWPLAAALLTPLGHGVMLAAAVWSMAATLWRGGVRWRDTFHPLAELRRGMVR